MLNVPVLTNTAELKRSILLLQEALQQMALQAVVQSSPDTVYFFSRQCSFITDGCILICSSVIVYKLEQ